MKKMKLVVVLALALSMLLGMTVNAEGSIWSVGSMKVGYDGEAIVDGEKVNVSVSELSWGADVQFMEELTPEVITDLTDLEYEVNVCFYDMPVIRQDTGEEVEHAEFPDGIVITLSLDYIKADSVVNVVHYGLNGWEDTPEILAVRDGEIDVKFTTLSPIAVLFADKEDTNTEDADKESSSEKSSSKSSKHSKSSAAEEEEEFWYTSLSSGGNVNVNGTVAQLMIGPSSVSLDEASAKALLGTTNSCTVHSTEIWLQDAAGNVITDGATVTINVPGVTAGSKVMVRHWFNGSYDYEDVTPSKVGDGYIVLNLSSMGRIAICVDNVPGSVAAAASTQVSPKTSENSMIYVVEALAVAALAGFVVCRRKIRK